jgi:glycerol-3-phosphate dehydrogenase (NAD(P)+)
VNVRASPALWSAPAELSATNTYLGYFARMATQVTVIGGGPWGIALAASAARNQSVQIVSRRDMGPALPAGVTRVSELAAAKDSQLIFLATPSEHARDVLRQLSPHLDGSHFVVHGVRGLEGAAMTTLSEIVRSETAVHRVGALGGPALAHELLHARPSVLVCGSRFAEVNKAVTQVFTHKTLRVYSTGDLRGLEWASALVGCLAILIGSVEKLDLGAGLIAALICRSIREASRIAAAAGGEPQTLLGLAGYGDLLASIAQPDRPEVVFGRALGEGLSREAAVARAQVRLEALELIPRVCRWATDHKVRAPIFAALAARVSGERDTAALLHDLMTLPIEDGA